MPKMAIEIIEMGEIIEIIFLIKALNSLNVGVIKFTFRIDMNADGQTRIFD
jgi:hypothetical protein